MSPNELRKIREKRAACLIMLRTHLRISKTKLSQVTGLSRVTIDKIENAKSSWSLETEAIYLSGLKLNDAKN